MKKKNGNEYKLLTACLFCEAAAFLLAMLFRYVVLNSFYWNPDRDYDFYKMFFVVVLGFYAVVFRIRIKKHPSFREMNGWENLAEVLKQHILLLIALTVFLYFIHSSDKISRTVMGFLIIYGVLFDLILRIRYGKRQARNASLNEKPRDVLLICCGDEALLKWNIEHYGYVNEKKGIRTNCRIAGTLSVSDKTSADELLNAARKQTFDMIYIQAAAAELLGAGKVKLLEQCNAPICRELSAEDKRIPTDTVKGAGGNAALYSSLLTAKCNVLGVDYTVAGLSETAAYLLEHSGELSGRYVCFSNVHTTVMAADDAEYRKVLNGSAATFPDGKPIADTMLGRGLGEAERVAGPDLMAELFRYSQGSGKKHFFYGSTEETLAGLKKNLAEKYPYMNVVGMYSPPFRELTEEEDTAIVDMINASGADYVWIGLGAPRQEKWMAAHQGRIKGLMLGVGAGFDFHAGTVKRAPSILQTLGLEWLYRLCSDPKRLLKRYLITNTKFIIYTTFRK